MISTENRFHGHNSLSYVYRHGKIVRGPVISTKYIRNDRRQQYRLAVVVSKKISKLAVDRNRIRRRLYETVRLLSPQIDGPYDIVITVFNISAQTLPYDQIEQMIRAQFKQAGIVVSKAPSRQAQLTPPTDTIVNNSN